MFQFKVLNNHLKIKQKIQYKTLVFELFLPYEITTHIFNKNT